MKRGGVRTMAVAVVLGLALGCGAGEDRSRAELATDHGELAAPPTEPARPAHEPAGAEASSPVMTGVLVAKAEVVLVAPGSGQLEDIAVELGQRVEAGAVVATLALREDEAEFAVSDASWRAARAELDRLELELEAARKDRADTETLEGIVSAAELRERRQAEALAAARKRSANAQLRAEGSKRREAEARVAAGQLRAPFAGSLTRRFVDPGATLGRGDAVVELVSTERLLRFAAPETALRAGAIVQGTTVEVRFAEHDRPIRAEVVALAPEIDATTRLVLVEASFDEDPGLRVGAVAEVRVVE